jgi:hypothetical protein
MSELVIIAAIVGLIAICVVLAPFVFGAGGSLQNASATDDEATLQTRKDAILSRWLQDEAAAAAGEITATEWKQRQRYLTSRYVDAARRLAWLRSFSALILAAVMTGAFMTAGPASAQVTVAPKQLWVIKAGTDQLHGTWVAAVMNKGSKPEAFRLPVLFPKESRDFQPLEGAEAADLKLAEDGLWVEKVYTPGVTVVSFAFVVPVTHGTQALSAVPRADVGEMAIMTPKGMLEIHGRDFALSASETADMERYDIMSSTRMIMKGDQLAVDIDGVPEGRRRLWLTGGVLAVILLGLSGLLVWRTRESGEDTSAQTI